MEDKIINIIYDELCDTDLYNYDNDEDLRNLKDIHKYTNICNEQVIDIVLEHEIYTIHCFKSYADKELENE